MSQFTLQVPPVDYRSLVPSITAAAADITLEVIPPPKGHERKSGSSSASPPFQTSNDFIFTMEAGTVLYDPTSVARYLARVSKAGSGALLPAVAPLEMAEWEQALEWEERLLHPAVLQALTLKQPLPQDIVAALVSRLAGRDWMVGDHLSLVDIVMWASLYPIYGSEGSAASGDASPLSTWFRRLAALPPFIEGMSRALSGSPPEVLLASLSARLASLSVANGQLPRGAAAGSEGKPRLPIPGKRNILVTSALPYVNNVPHLGNIIGCVLSADVYARFCRRRGYNVIYMCGTDEYGTATETKAMAEGVSPKEICDKYHAIHKEIYEWFGISFDKFGRTSTPQQTEIAQGIFKSLLREERLLEDTMEQPYCDTCKRFLADRFVEGSCPTPGCGYDDARGDQCDKCGKLLNPVDLINPRCNICRNPPRIRQTEHLFLDLPALKDRLEAYVTATSAAGGWSQNSIHTTNAWIRDGLKPRCITRDLKWGVPVPLEKYKEKVFYVWFDAPIGYISITANYTEQWREWWQRPEDVELVQFMGKDNVPFHTVIFPCTLLGTNEPWTLMRTISVTEYLNYEGGKFSKSRGVGVFGNDAKSTSIPVEVWRYYLLTNRPEVSDTMFTWADLQAKQNNELLKNLGNFVNRALAFLAKPAGEGYGSVVPDAEGAGEDALTAALGQKVGEAVREYVDNMEKVKLKAGLKTAMALSSLGNLYLQESQFWKLYKGDPARCAAVLRTSVGVVHLLATLLEPFMPTFAHKVLKQLAMPDSSLALSEEAGDLERAFRPWEIMPAQHRIGQPEPIFAEMKDEEVEAYRVAFSGSQADRIAAEVAASQGKGAAAAAGSAPAAAGLPKAKKKATAGEEKGGAKGGEKKGKAAGDGGGAKESKDGPVDVSRLDIRVGRIVKVEKHPDADSLYVEQIDVGEAAPRTVVSGLVKFVPIEEMQDRLVCVLCNLKPANMRGVKSHAMVLAASNAEHTKVELVTPPEGSKPGERISAPGYQGEPDALLNPKKKVWEAVQPDLKTGPDFVAAFRDAPLSTAAGGVCTVASLAGASIA